MWLKFSKSERRYSDRSKQDCGTNLGIVNTVWSPLFCSRNEGIVILIGQVALHLLN